MSDNIVDAVVSGSAPADISQEIKDILFAKASDRIDTFRNVTASHLFNGSEAEEEVEAGEEE